MRCGAELQIAPILCNVHAWLRCARNSRNARYPRTFKVPWLILALCLRLYAQVGGYVMQYAGGRFTLVVVRNAGHSVPTFQPRGALQMATAFLKGEQL